jgi:hypothetical protein
MALHKFPEGLQESMESLTLEEEIQLFADELKEYFSIEELEKIAREVGFVQRQGKIEAWHFLFLCGFIGVNVANDTLVTLCSKIGEKLNIIVSNQAIDKRFTTKCVEFLEKVFYNLLKTTLKPKIHIQNKLDEHFDRIRILDSTGFQLPEKYADVYPGSGGNASSAGVKIQLEFELKSGNFINIGVSSGKDSDCTYGKTIRDTVKARDLFLRDLGYFDLDDYEDIDSKGAFYISRVKSSTAVYTLNDNDSIEYFSNGLPKKSSIHKKIDFLDIMNDMQEGQTIEIKKAFVGKYKKLPVRLIIYKHTAAETENIVKNAEKEAKKKGKAKSEKTMNLLGICIFMTNIPDEILTAEQFHEVYSLRWQIELIFKTWKSVYDMAKVKDVKIERFKCQLYGKLILVLLSSTLTFRARTVVLQKKNKEISEIKASEIICEYIGSLYLEIINSSKKVFHILTNLFESILKNGKKSHRKNKKTAFDIMGVSYERNECNAVV